MAKSETYLLDTSFVVRLLTRDPLPLYKQASDFLSESTAPLVVPDLALAESYFALQYHYGFGKAEALEMLRLFSEHPMITCSVSARQVLRKKKLAAAQPGFVDRLIHGCAREAGANLVTFEKSARKLPRTIILSAKAD